MKRSFTGAIRGFAVVALLALSLVAVASQRLGLNIPLLTFFGTTSTNNVARTFGSDYKLGPSVVEISWLAYPEDAGLGTPPARFQNGRTIIDKLTGAGKIVYATVYLGIHRSGALDLTRYKKWRDEFFTPYKSNSRVRFVVCPSLEDNATDARYNQWVDLMAANTSSADQSRIVVRRSPDPGNGSRALGSRHSFAALRLELHGTTPVGNVFSNDGAFVYDTTVHDGNAYEARTSMVATGQGFLGQEQSISDFRASIVAWGGTTLLWRPAYNLFVRQSSGSILRHNKDIRQTPPSDSQVSFNSQEIAVARKFFGIN